LTDSVITGRRPKVSVITPTYNRADLIRETIDSILGQTFGDFEYIIIDDGSTDGTEAVVKGYGDPRVAYHFHANRGEAASTNRGWQLARGEYVAVVSSDDPVLPGWLEQSVAFMNERPDLIVGYPEWHIIDENSQFVSDVPMFDYSFSAMVGWMQTLPGPGSLIRKDAVRDIDNLRNPTYSFVSDLESWWRLGLRGPFARIPAKLATWRRHPTSITVADRSLRRAREMIRLPREFFARNDVPPEIGALRRYTFSRAYWIAAWVVLETHPLRSALYLQRSYVLAPDDPPGLPQPLRRYLRPSSKALFAAVRKSFRRRGSRIT
jgi:glycosyltransferase involved in cell wall biosynthesis